MSIITQVASSNFGTTGLPVLERRVYGFTKTGLGGLYLFSDGTSGASYSTALDSSGNGNHAPLKAGYTAPICYAGGVQVAALTGAPFITPIAQADAVTFILVGQLTGFDGLTGHGFPQAWRNSQGIPASPGSNASNVSTEAGPTLAVDYQNSSALKRFISLFADSTEHSLASNAENATAVAFSFDPTTGTTRVTVSSGTSTSAAEFVDSGKIGKTYSAFGGTYALGLMKNFSEARLTGNLMLGVVYTRALSASDAARAVLNAKSIVAARGVTVA